MAERSHPRSHIWNIAAILALIFVSVFNGSLAAQATAATSASTSVVAAPGPSPLVWQPDLPVNEDWSVCSENYKSWQRNAAKSPLLPVNRWASGSSMHTRLGDGMVEQVQSVVQGNFLNSTMLNLGNAVWGASIAISELSYRMCFMEEAALQADKVLQPVGEALIDSGFLIMLVIMAIGTLFWRAHRNSRLDWKAVFRIVAAVGLFTSMVMGAAATDVKAGTFGTLSPGWWGTKINDGITGVAAVPLEKLSEAVIIESNATAPTPVLYKAPLQDPMSCDSYVAQLRKDYDALYGGRNARFSRVPVMLDALWQQSGLKIYRDIQFGMDSEIGRRVYCRQLDYDAEVSPTDQVAMTTKAWPELTKWDKAPISLAFAPTDNLSVDRSVIGWASCQIDASRGDSSIHLVPGFDVLESEFVATGGLLDVPMPDGGIVPNKTADAADCLVWLAATPEIEQKLRGATRNLMVESRFDWNINSEKIAERTGIYGDKVGDAKATAINDFINAYQGHSNRAATGLLVVYILSSVINFIVFGGIGLSILVAKLAVYVLIALAFFHTLVALVKDSESPMRYFKAFVGVAFYAVILQALLLVVGLVTALLNSVGAEMSPLFIVLWSAIAPLVAAAGAVILAKQSGMPNPLRPSSALAFGGAGGAMLGGFMSRAENKAINKTRSVGKKSVNAMNPLSAGKGQRDGATGAAAVAKKKPLTAAQAASDSFAAPPTSPAKKPVGAPAAGAAAPAAAAAGGSRVKGARRANLRSGIAGTAMGRAVGMTRAKRANALAARRADRIGKGLFNERSGGLRGGMARVGNSAWQGARYIGSHPLQSAKIAKKGLKYGTVGAVAAMALPLPLAGAALATAVGIKAAKKLWSNRPPAKGYTEEDQKLLDDYRTARGAKAADKKTVKADRKGLKSLEAWETAARDLGWEVGADGKITRRGVPVSQTEIEAKIGKRPEATPGAHRTFDARTKLYEEMKWRRGDDGNVWDSNGQQVPLSRVNAMLASSGLAVNDDAGNGAGIDSPDSPQFEEQARQLLSSGSVTDAEALAKALSCSPVIAKQAFDRYGASKNQEPTSENANPVTGETEDKSAKPTGEIVTGGDREDESDMTARRIDVAQDISNPGLMLPELEDFGSTAPEPTLPGLETVAAAPAPAAAPVATARRERPQGRPAPTRTDLIGRRTNTTTSRPEHVSGSSPHVPDGGIVGPGKEPR